ncbi:hypothetical protein DFJ74DRAFT_319993 [Hyaloraphidium curvatum]|nr:hypothetical protein DFJ74DRAFT_319993 [Hyaloraphidium curvatum]
MPPPTSLATTNNPARPANAPAAKPPRKRSEDPRPWGNPYFWIILFVLLPSAALSGVAWILWNTWTLEFPDAVTLALPLRVLSYLAFISLGLSFTFLLLSIVGDQCCTAPDPSSTSDRRIRKQPPVWLVDLRLALSVLVACAFLGTLVSYSVALSPNVSFLNSACAVPGVFCGQARAALGLASAAGFGWLLLAVWSGVSRKKAVWARAMKQAARV